MDPGEVNQDGQERQAQRPRIGSRNGGGGIRPLSIDDVNRLFSESNGGGVSPVKGTTRKSSTTSPRARSGSIKRNSRAAVLKVEEAVPGLVTGSTRDVSAAIRTLNRLVFGPGPSPAESATDPMVGVCPVTWGTGGIAFRCLDCELDSNCVVCPDCFYGGNHEGHHIKLIRTVGGCCDCGDEASWRKSGFCSKHQGLAKEDDSRAAFEGMPLEQQKRVETCVPAVLKYLVRLLQRRPIDVMVVKGIISWLLDQAKASLGFRYFITERFSRPIPSRGAGASLLNDMIVAFNGMATERLVRKVGEEFKQVTSEAAEPGLPLAALRFGDDDDDDDEDMEEGIDGFEDMDDFLAMLPDAGDERVAAALEAAAAAAMTARGANGDEENGGQDTGEQETTSNNGENEGGDGELRQEVDGAILMRTMEDLLSQQRDSFAMNPFKRVLQAVNDFMLTMSQLSPTFKLQFTKVFMSHYDQISSFNAEQYQASGASSSSAQSVQEDEEAPPADIAGMSVQLLTIPEICVALMKPGSIPTGQGNLLEVLFARLHSLFGGIYDNQNLTLDLSVLMGSGPRELDMTIWRVTHDISYVLYHPQICEMFLSSPEMQRQLLSSVSMLSWMNPQMRALHEHVPYENKAWRTAFKLEGGIASTLRSLGSYCSAPDRSLESLMGFYEELVGAIMARYRESPPAATAMSKSFHLPLIRLLTSCINFDLLLSTSEEDMLTWLEVFPIEALLIILKQVVGVLTLSGEIHSNLWVRNGGVMMQQRSEYFNMGLKNSDEATVQVCLILLREHYRRESTGRVQPLAVLMASVMQDRPISSSELEEIQWRRQRRPDGSPNSLQVLPTPPPPGTSVWQYMEASCFQDALCMRTLWMRIVRSSLLLSGDSSSMDPRVERCYISVLLELLLNSVSNPYWITMKQVFGHSHEKKNHGPPEGSRQYAEASYLAKRAIVQVLAYKNMTFGQLTMYLPGPLRSCESIISSELDMLAQKVGTSNRRSSSARERIRSEDIVGEESNLDDHEQQEGSSRAVYSMKADSWSYYDAYCLAFGNSKQREAAMEHALSKPEVGVIGPADEISSLPSMLDKLTAVIVDSLVLVSPDQPSGSFDIYELIFVLVKARTFELHASTKTEQAMSSAKLSALDWTIGVAIRLADLLAQCIPPVSVTQSSVLQDYHGLGAVATAHDLHVKNELNDRKGLVLGYGKSGRIDVYFHPGGIFRLKEDNIRLENTGQTNWAQLMRSTLQELSHLDEILPILGRTVKSALGRRSATKSSSTSALGRVTAENDLRPGASSRQRRLESAKKRQKKIMKVMRKRQVAFLESMKPAGSAVVQEENKGFIKRIFGGRPQATKSTTSAETEQAMKLEKGAPESEQECALCRESDTIENLQRTGPLCVVADLGRGRVAGPGVDGNGIGAYINSCGHMVHSKCWSKHRSAIRMRHEGHHDFFFVDVEKGEAPCPMCRSLANLCIPYTKLSVLTTPDAKWYMPWNRDSISPDRVARAMATCEMNNLVKAVWESKNNQAAADGNSSPAIQGLQGSDKAQTRAELLLNFAYGHLLAVMNTMPSAVVECACSEPQHQVPTFAILLRSLAAEIMTSGSDPQGSNNEMKLLAMVVGRRMSQSQLSAEFGRLWKDLKSSGKDDEAALDHLTEVGMMVCWAVASLNALEEADLNRLRFAGLGDPKEAWCTIVSILDIPDPLASMSVELAAVPTLQTRPRPMFSSEMVTFIDLPQSILDLVHRTLPRICKNCKSSPLDPVVCLLCGDVLCLDGDCCRIPSQTEGECTRHARSCGGGQGLFIIPYASVVLAIAAPRNCIWDGPYEDSHGETDSYLRRNLADLTLSKRRYDQLKTAFIRGTIDMEIIKNNEKTGRFVPRAL